MRKIDADALVEKLEKLAEAKRQEGKALHADVIAEFIACVREEPTASEWISVKDARPAKKVTVLAIVGVGNSRHIEMACSGYNRSGAWWSVTHNNVIPAWSVTHWMPMPELAKEG